MTTITLDHVSKQYPLESKLVYAVDDVTIQIKSGDTLSILGPSGSGKTTLLRLIAGLEQPDSGQILHNGKRLHETPLEDRNIGMVFQDYALIPHWDAQTTIGFFLRLRRREREVPERVRQVSKITGVGINHLLSRKPKDLSGGEKQRVAIARAFARDLQLLLFDEPFANLDAKFRTTARAQARRLLDRFPVTTIYVTHDQQEAATMGEKIIVMRDGHIEQIGDYQTLYYDPINRFVAEFIGTPTMNMFEGTIEDGRWYGTYFGGIQPPNPINENQEVTLGIRAEHIMMDGDIPAQVKHITPFFAERYQVVEIQLGDKLCEMRVPLEQKIQVGDTIKCSFDTNYLYFFDTHTGDRL